MNGSTSGLKEHILKLCENSVRRTLLYDLVAESLKSTEGEEVQLRRAKAFAHLLASVDTVILPHETVVGSMLGICPVWDSPLSAAEQEQKAFGVIESYLQKKREGADGTLKFEKGHAKSFEEDFTSRKSRWSLMSRVHHDASVEYSDLMRLTELAYDRFKSCGIEKYEVGRELERAFKIDFDPEVKRLFSGLPWFIGNHLSLNYKKVLEKGLSGLRREILSHLGEADGERSVYYTAALITADAVIGFIGRYADALRGHSAKETDIPRKNQLLEMAEICERISLSPAKTFREAVQLTWLLHVIASIQGGSALSLGRVDGYLYPYYIKDRESGVLSYDGAKELLSCVWLKINEPKMRTVQSVTLGGAEYNELTRLCLEVTAEVAMPYPNVGLRVHDGTPEWVYSAALASVKAGCGQPMLMNDGVWVRSLEKLGYSKELAESYYNMGCVEIMIPGKQPNWGVTDAIAFPVAVERVMQKQLSGEINADSFEEVMNECLYEIDAAVERDVLEAAEKKENMRGRCFDPYSSLLTDGCLEKGADMFQEGSECPTHWAVYAYGIGTAADSLAAVKRLVFDRKEMTFTELCAICRDNFEGAEPLRRVLSEDMPCYGNGDEEVDAIADRLLSHYAETVLSKNGRLGRDRFVSTLFGYFFHIYHGEIAGATPNGRRKGEPFSDSMGPSQGCDTHGPTALIRSVLRLNNGNVTGGYALNFKVDPKLFHEERGVNALKALLKTYIQQGGPQIQLYTTNTDDLKDATVHPEKHRDLIVRVGGYCEFFVNLDRSLQQEIIKRTLYEE